VAKVNARVVLNRAALDAVTLGLADGLFDVARQIVTTARPPSDVETETPAEHREETRRSPLVRNGGAIAWVSGRKIAGFSLDGRAPKKPREVRTPRGQIVAVAGFGFPGRFTEFGTIHETPHPFLSPAIAETLPEAVPVLRAAMQTRLAGVP
jgi:hypothetical protein